MTKVFFGLTFAVLIATIPLFGTSTRSVAAGRCSTGEYNSCVRCCNEASASPAKCINQCRDYLKPK